MPIVAVAGELVTTTAVALAAAWPEPDGVLFAEADPSGGDVAAWFDLPESPSLSTLVTRLREPSITELQAHRHLVVDGRAVVPCPAMPVEAALAVAESAAVVVPMLSGDVDRWTVVDVGREDVRRHPWSIAAEAVVLVHRQAPQSARASAVRLQRLPERVTRALQVVPRVVVAVVGDRPFGIGEIEPFLLESVTGSRLADGRPGDVLVVGMPDDPLAAAVLGGRTGVSDRRFGRLPLLRSARGLADAVLSTVGVG